MQIIKLGLTHALSNEVDYEVKNTLYHGNTSHLIIKFRGKCEEKRTEKHKNGPLVVEVVTVSP